MPAKQRRIALMGFRSVGMLTYTLLLAGQDLLVTVYSQNVPKPKRTQVK